MDVEAKIGGDINRETEFVLSHFGVEAPELIAEVGGDDELIILDTNNPDELITGYEKVEILEIIDHHKLAGLTTASPLSVTIEPVACVATILHGIMQQAGYKPEKQMAGLMLAAILSDTLKFTSPTTTDRDKEVAEIFAKLCGEDIDKLADQMFAAKSNLDGMSAAELITSDAKDYELNGSNYKVGVLETTDPSQALEMQDDLVDAMTEIVENEGLDGIFFFVVDIIRSEATLVIASEVEEVLAKDAFEAEVVDGLMVLPGVVSRKKQIVPNIEKATA